MILSPANKGQGQAKDLTLPMNNLIMGYSTALHTR
jgi:hypothetical protein